MIPLNRRNYRNDEKNNLSAPSKCRSAFAVSRIFVGENKQQVHASKSHNQTRLCVHVEDELNISLGLLCCCGCSVWEERQARVRERAAVAMVRTGRQARRIL